MDAEIDESGKNVSLKSCYISLSGLSSEYLFDVVQCAIDFKSRSTSRGFGVSSKYSLLSLGCCHFQSFFRAILRDSKGQVESMCHFVRIKRCDSLELQDVANCRVFSDLALMYQNYCCFSNSLPFFGCLNRFFPWLLCVFFSPRCCVDNFTVQGEPPQLRTHCDSTTRGDASGAGNVVVGRGIKTTPSIMRNLSYLEQTWINSIHHIFLVRKKHVVFKSSTKLCVCVFDDYKLPGEPYKRPCF